MDYEYIEFPERPGLDGLRDKLAVMSAVAWKHAENNLPFRNHVLNVVKNAGQAVDGQFRVWEKYCKTLLYRREPGEVVRGVDDTENTGGDCDDLAIFECAGLRSLQIPCLLQILTDDEGNGYHIRCLVGFPPIDPTTWVVSDPSEQQEKQWAMDGKKEIMGSLDGRETLTLNSSMRNLSLTEGDSVEPSASSPSLLKGIAIGAGLVLFGQWIKRKM